MLLAGRAIRIPLGEFTFQYARSSGAGGQNVNKVSSKAILRWDVGRSPSLPEAVRRRFVQRYRRRITGSGELVLASQRYRDQRRNVTDCFDKLAAMLEAVEAPPAPRRPTRPGRAARARRLDDKRARSEIKRRRGRVTGTE